MNQHKAYVALQAKYARAVRKIRTLEAQLAEVTSRANYPYELDPKMCLTEGCGRKPIGLGYCSVCLGVKKADMLPEARAPIRGTYHIAKKGLKREVRFFT